MEIFVDKSKITYKSHITDMRNFFFFYHSKAKESYVSPTGVHMRCKMPCDLDHPYYWSNMPFNAHYNDKILREDVEAIGCFGCSNTYGACIQEQESWPFLLGTALKTNCINFGVGAAGIDSVYLNLKASAKDYKFKKAIILLPGFARRLGRIYHRGNWFRWPVMPGHPTLWKDLLSSPIHENLGLDNDIFVNHGKKVINKIIHDVEAKYQKKVLERLIKFCRKTYEQFYVSSWEIDTYQYISDTYKEHIVPMYDLNGPKASDGIHPTLFQNTRFTNSIINFFDRPSCS